MAQTEKRPADPSPPEDEQRRQPDPIEAGIGREPGDRPRQSDVTNVHDVGSDANDTPDGLTESEEAARQATEDVPIGGDPAGPEESVPVFDRGSLPPKI